MEIKKCCEILSSKTATSVIIIKQIGQCLFMHLLYNINHIFFK